LALEGVMTGEDNVPHKRVDLDIRKVLTFVVDVFPGNTKVDHEDVARGPLLPFFTRWHILVRSDLPAGLFNLLKALELLTAPGKLA